MNKRTKLFFLIFLLLTFFLVFLFLVFSRHDYEVNYNVKGFQITEKYDKEKEYYTFLITKDKLTYPFIIISKNFIERDLVDNILTFSEENEECILPVSAKLTFYPLCSNSDELYTLNLSNIETSYKFKKTKDLNQEYNDTKIHYLNNAYFAIYDYNGFNIINSKENKNIKLFNQDVYNINLIYQMDNILLIPDYNSKYYFNKFYYLNMQNGKLEEINTDFDISFESIFLGHYKNKIYLLDKKEEVEYEINLKKKIVSKVDFQILENNKFVSKTYKEIVKNNLNFISENKTHYEIIDNTLYKNINNILIKLSDKKVNKIIYNNEDTIYYLTDTDLYMYNDIYGEVLLLSNSEWDFNNSNVIFIN